MYIADFSKGNGYSKNDLYNIGTPIILYGRLYTKYQFAINEVDTFVIPKEGSVYSQGNEVIIPASGETAEDIARASAVEKSGILLGGDLNILSPFSFINPLFLALAISNGEPQKELAKKAQGKSVVHIRNSDIQEVSVSFPTRTEQNHIVSVFRTIDDLITLHQRKCEKLEIIKKLTLSKIFFENNENDFIIRFKNYTNSWEQRKLGDTISDLKSGLSRMLSEVDIGLPVIRANNINNEKLNLYEDIKYWYLEDPQGADTSNYFIHKNDILINFINSEVKMGTCAIVEKEPDRFTIYTTNILRMRVNESLCDVNFFLSHSKVKKYKDYIKGISKIAVNQASFTTVDFKKYDIYMPKLEEQRKIGAYFRNLDKLITLHKSKVEKLKNIKKALLGKMFV